MAKVNTVSECRVSFRTDEGRPFADVCLNEEPLINNLVLQPMSNARRDLEPARYAFVGTLTMISTDGSRKDVTLFFPWGHYSCGDDYFVADFGGLKAACKMAIRIAERRVAADDKEGM
jgi:hypothetical protein